MVVFDRYPTLPLSEFRDELLFEFQDLPTELFDYYILRVARDMAQRGSLLRRQLRIELQPCVTRYSVESPDGLEVNALTDARFVPDGNIEHGNRILRRFITQPEHLGPFTHGTWYLPDERVIVLHVPACAPTGYCLVTMTALPARDACELPRIYKDDYLIPLMYGVRSQIMMISNKPWSNMNMGAALQQLYEKELADVSIREQTVGQQGIVKMRHGRVL